MDIDLKVDTVSVRPVQVPLPVPHRTASGVISESPLVLIDITASDGSIGHAIVFTYTPAALVPCAGLIENIAPLVEGQPLAPRKLSRELTTRFKLLGTQGLVGMALAGIDMAMWDALSRANQMPLLKMLGGDGGRIKPYGAVGFDGASGSAKTAENLVKQGFRGIKAKIGYATVEEDVAVIRSIRSAVGSEVAIMVDYNQSLDPVDALIRLQHLDDEGLTWVEEPVMTNDYASNANLAASTATPVQCGENWWGIADMQHALAAEACNLVMPDVMKIGGVTGWLQAAALAEAHHIPMSNHLWPELSARLLCVTPTAHWLEYSDWWNPVLAQPLEVKDGYAVIDDRVGCGISWNEKSVARYLI